MNNQKQHWSVLLLAVTERRLVSVAEPSRSQEKVPKADEVLSRQPLPASRNRRDFYISTFPEFRPLSGFILVNFDRIIDFFSINVAKIAIFDFKISAKIMRELEQFGIVPVDYGVLLHVFAGYQSPADKISALVKRGDLIRLKKGLFVVAPQVHRMPLSVDLIANHLYGPSYVSFEKALSRYNLIPEQVIEIRSAVTGRGRQYTTPLGNYSYVKVPELYYSTGIRQETGDNGCSFLIASPEKAVCDMIIGTPGLRLQSVKAVRQYLEDDLRMDFPEIQKFDKAIIRECIKAGRKAIALNLFLEYLGR